MYNYWCSRSSMIFFYQNIVNQIKSKINMHVTEETNLINVNIHSFRYWIKCLYNKQIQSYQLLSQGVCFK